MKLDEYPSSRKMKLDTSFSEIDIELNEKLKQFHLSSLEKTLDVGKCPFEKNKEMTAYIGRLLSFISMHKLLDNDVIDTYIQDFQRENTKYEWIQLKCRLSQSVKSYLGIVDYVDLKHYHDKYDPNHPIRVSVYRIRDKLLNVQKIAD